MAEYRLNGPDESRGVIREVDRAYIPPDSGNMDWVAYLAWKEEGGVPDPEPPRGLQKIIVTTAFFSRFTQAELEALWGAAVTHNAVGVALMKVIALGSIQLDGDTAVAWLTALVQLGVLTSARAQEIATPQQEPPFP